MWAVRAVSGRPTAEEGSGRRVVLVALMVEPLGRRTGVAFVWIGVDVVVVVGLMKWLVVPLSRISCCGGRLIMLRRVIGLFFLVTIAPRSHGLFLSLPPMVLERVASF